MFDKFKKHTKYDDAIDKVLAEFEEFGPDTSEFETMIERLERLQKLRSDELSGRVTGDTAAIVGANVLSVLIMVAYERANVMTSKSLGMLLRTKLH